MKIRESGMPEESVWVNFFTPEEVLHKLGLSASGDAVDFGCGYGTFTIPAAQITTGTIHALDIDAEMVAATKSKAEALGLQNVRTYLRDFITSGTGLPDKIAGYVMLFNILHAECPGVFLREALRVLMPGGKLGLMHWNYDPATPRGPSMDIRPRPEQCREWGEAIGFRFIEQIDLPPYHWGIVMERPI
ncbi:MAG: class I SAM-dependent methyltransferase [Thermoguttaceae bacterium]|jgi:ubiquinone/menaquinone biosynthesis C-methylase UbiE